MIKRRWIFLKAMVGCLALFARDEATAPLPVGNFSVPTVSEIGPLIGFGQLLIGQNALLAQLSGFYTRGHKDYANLLTPNVIYGIRDDLSLLVAVPVTLQARKEGSYSSGIDDMLLQGEYGYYMKSGKEYAVQGTIVGNVQFPTGSSHKDPRTGNGSFSYFLGTTFSFVSPNWYAFVSPGVDLTSKHQGTKFGNSYLYQWGVARYIKALSPPGWIFDLMVEFDGTYTRKDRFHGASDPNSGGNVIFVTPSIWLSSKHLVLQWGMGFPIVQELHGRQDKVRYTIAYILAAGFQF